MGMSFLNRNSNFPVAYETPPKPSGCLGKAQEDLYAGKNPFWGCLETSAGIWVPLIMAVMYVAAQKRQPHAAHKG
jgi:hypothetical protein